MAVLPAAPSPPGAPAPLEPPRAPFVPPPMYSAPPSRPRSTKTLIVIGLIVAAAAWGFMRLLRRSPTEIYDTLGARLGKLTCPRPPGGQTDLQILMSSQLVNVFVPDADPNLRDCLTRGLQDLRFNGASDEIIMGEMTLTFDDAGRPTIMSSPRRTQRLSAEWRLGVLGDHLSRHRAELQDVLDARVGAGVECYLDHRARALERLPTMSWHTKDAFSVRGWMEPDGQLGPISMDRPGPQQNTRDWSNTQSFGGCFGNILDAVVWPRHGGPKKEWLNTTFSVTRDDEVVE